MATTNISILRPSTLSMEGLTTLFMKTDISHRKKMPIEDEMSHPLSLIQMSKISQTKQRQLLSFDFEGLFAN
jgi:hypothetical protein